MSSGEIVLLDLEWIAFAAGAAAGDDGNFPGMAAGEEEDFGRNDVDGIHDGVVGLFEESVCISLGEEFTDLPDFGGRVDGAEAFCHDRHFGSSKIFRGGVDLSVGVGDAEVVEVDEGEVADARAGEGLGGPGPDAADAYDRDASFVDPFGGGLAVEATDASETWGDVVHGQQGIIRQAPRRCRRMLARAVVVRNCRRFMLVE